ncbi:MULTISPECIES: endonuclease/exonuclease/phosphatase family protein [Silvimonas]|uniref:endonuclease/exonuclease/phosphatase family protein n=1 Tax=Silvimonas TaxID=300264 RepID=UPI0024B36016|nr:MULTISPECIES: endonuclease/exonuclease/phosphatase family protein [Silvimonas]MDR3428635.1 endonuclease/exonuclease/phosphatase family protein [Silvimonas sp.]
MERRIKVASYNIHKGLSPLNRRLVVHDVRQALKTLEPDLVFLQEVQGAHSTRAQRFTYWPATPQHEYLAGDELASAYGRNAIHRLGHHGNALLSRFPIMRWGNHDITLNRFEQRGLLHCVLDIPGWNIPLHAFCVHLNLLARDRRKQLTSMVEQIQREVPKNAPLVIAGDFNDWRREATRFLGNELHVIEAFETLHGSPARSFPVRMPVLSLDRVYVRGFGIEVADVLGGRPWSNMSDHAPLYTVLRRG